MSEKLIPFKVKKRLTPRQECVRDILKRLEDKEVRGFVILMETDDPDSAYLEGTSNVGPGLIGVLESVKQRLIDEMNNDVEEFDDDPRAS